MHQWLWFTHMISVALWFGSLVAAAWVAASALRTDRADQRAWGLSLTHRISSSLSIPASALVVLAGLAMVIQGGMVGTFKPLWFKVMEMGGGTLVLLSIPPLLWLGRRMVRVAKEDRSVRETLAAARSYMGALMTVALGQAAIILVVSLRLG